jgi:hypothetical protein
MKILKFREFLLRESNIEFIKDVDLNKEKDQLVSKVIKLINSLSEANISVQLVDIVASKDNSVYCLVNINDIDYAIRIDGEYLDIKPMDGYGITLRVDDHMDAIQVFSTKVI